ncbi:ubiquinol-cytochrome c reductase iron-sulfur subunit [Alloacidobacterium sp.]|uniref:QcrA and Rieske domain-containing protein n=1 Tax=Alloacidobacterium sp. TaxID=2951999 RepID=UPI002D429020|nr:Rieske 2Fe-2S domain-containing protein [Alloacidobacterium sp.]HYK35901.1 Rieske 2Fe-2S domain-containing protein [Alloacidobacterium sp.]
MSEKKQVTRRTVLMAIGFAFNAVVGAAIAIPVIGYVLSPIKKKSAYLKWISLGALDQFPEGQTRLATFVNPFEQPQDGETAKTPCWVRHVSGDTFQVFAINCAHLGCPVRWFPQSELFMCPCHGGVYYADGERASGPPERGLFTYNYKIVKGELHINAGQMPTLADQAMLGKGKSPCLG